MEVAHGLPSTFFLHINMAVSFFSFSMCLTKARGEPFFFRISLWTLCRGIRAHESKTYRTSKKLWKQRKNAPHCFFVLFDNSKHHGARNAGQSIRVEYS